MLPHASLRSASLAGTCIRRCSVAVLSMIAASAFLARAAVADVSLSEETGSSERANLYSLDEASKNDLLVCCNLQFSMTTSLYWQVRPHEVARLCGRLSVPRASAGPRSNRLLTRTLGSSDVAAPARTARLIRPGKTFHCRPGSVITVTVLIAAGEHRRYWRCRVVVNSICLPPEHRSSRSGSPADPRPAAVATRAG